MATISPRSRAASPELATILVVDGDSAGHPPVLGRPWSAAPRRVHAGRHGERRPGDDHLHLGHDRPAEGCAACAPRCCWGHPARGAITARFLSATPAISTGPRPIGRGSAGSLTCCCRASISVSRVLAPPRRQIRPRGSLRADRPAWRAQRLPAADRAPDDAAGRRAARALRLRSALGGERRRGAHGEDILAWSREALGVAVNEFYGQTEAEPCFAGNLRRALFRSAPGRWEGRSPGTASRVVSPEGATPCRRATPVSSRCIGPDPVMFLGYWNNPEASAAKFAGDWVPDRRRGDPGSGRLHLVQGPRGRSDLERRPIASARPTSRTA